ncbi:MAG: ribonuclease Z [Candidatus Bathyarchaeota archaeon]|nr:ribonuclease Z [Candidatus Bathyarchaeota archaeon]
MSVRVVFLGTSGSVPTLKRSLPCIVVQTDKGLWMFDCGEGAQRQMMQNKVSFHKKLKILITHLHGDHMLGLPGLLQTMALMDRKEPVQVYGPVGLATFLQCTKDTLNFGLTYPVEIYEIMGEGTVCEEDECTLQAVKSNHSIEGFCFALIEKPRPGRFYPQKAKALGVPAGELWSKLQQGEEIVVDEKTVLPSQVMGPVRAGRKIVYTGDTKPFAGFAEFARDADLLIHECTFDDSMVERADVDGHSTPKQAAGQAKAAKAKRLVLTHISARYSDATVLLEQAKTVFADVVVAEDGLVLELPLSE